MCQVYIEGGVIRKLWVFETYAYGEHLLRLDSESRRNRFCAEIDESMIRSYAATAHGPDTVLFGFFIDGMLRGVSDLRIVSDHQEAEAAFSIEKPWQRLGVGSALLERTLLCARNRGIKHLHVNCLMENQRMQRLARRFEAEIVFDFGSVVGTMRNAVPTPISLMRELTTDSQSLAAAYFDFHSRALMPQAVLQ